MNHVFRKLMSAASAAALAVTAAGVLPQPMKADAASLTGCDAWEITSKMTVGWNLGNTLDAHGGRVTYNSSPALAATSWGCAEPSQAQFDAVKAKGFNTVRIPTTWYQHIKWDDTSQMYLINDEWMGYVKKTVDYAYDQDMFVILNMHHEDFINVSGFTDATYADASKKLQDIWTQVAEEFKDYDQHLIFEGMNEPREVGTRQEWTGGNDDGKAYVNKLNAVFVSTVRGQGSSANKERLLMLPAYGANNSQAAVSSIQIPSGAGNVALSVHAYTPYYFCMANDSYANHNYPGQSGWGADYTAELQNMFGYLETISENKNAPIIMGEFSAANFDNTSARVAWATDYVTMAKNAGIHCVLWDNNAETNPSDPGEAHGYLNRSSATWYSASEPVVDAMVKIFEGQQQEVDTSFDYSKVPVGDDWIAIAKTKNGIDIGAWDNVTVDGWKEYVNENYDLVLVSEYKSVPELVLQGTDSSWNRIAASSSTQYSATFTYSDIKNALGSKDLSIMYQLFISATNDSMTSYGLFAVPKTQEPTQAPTEEPQAILGDLNGDMTVSVLDIVTLQKYLVRRTNLNHEVFELADLNGDGKVNVIDLTMLKYWALRTPPQN
ncbi:MAG: cellulase family glycosylhydrolase [Oscillospiraceae bacterium]|nr:cellulase family glycosylhydrolase [Oscillospiraceae bacterium]